MFLNDNIYFYHIYNRGVDKRNIFLDQEDYQYFYDNLFLFNDRYYQDPGGRKSTRNSTLVQLGRGPTASEGKFVEILAFCLMPNHFHLLLATDLLASQSLFIKKVSQSYTQYFNQKYQRSGVLFQGKYKRKLIESSEYLYHLPRYIHLNALDLFNKSWRYGSFSKFADANQILNYYPWSSHHIFQGTLNLNKKIIDRKLIKKYISFNNYQKYLKEWYDRSLTDAVGPRPEYASKIASFL